jgi:hypothetical protein
MSLSNVPLPLNDDSDDDHIIVREKQIEDDRRLAEMLTQLWEEEDRLEREGRRLHTFTNEMLDTRSNSSTSATTTTTSTNI